MVTDDSVSELISIVTYNLLSSIPQVEEIGKTDPSYTDERSGQFLFLEFSLLWAPRTDYSDNKTIKWMNIGLGFSAELHFFNYFALDLGTQFVQEISGGEANRDLLLEVPLALKLVLRPFENIMLEPYGGVSFNFSLMDKTKPSLCSYFGGLQFNLKIGSGYLVIDPRVSLDANFSDIGTLTNYRRVMMQAGIGYKTGFFSKGGRNQDN